MSGRQACMAECVPLVRSMLSGSRGQALAVGLRGELESSLASAFPPTRVRAMEQEPHRLGSAGDAQERDADRAADAIAGGHGRSGGRGVDLSAVRLHTGTLAAQSARALGTVAYTAGTNIVLDDAAFTLHTDAGRHVLAHEAAHVLQNSRSGDAATVRRYTVFSESQQRAGSSQGWKHPAFTGLRVSDDGVMASENKEWGPGTAQRAWTTPAKIAESNKILSGVDSRARLRALGGGESISGKAPTSGTQSTLQEIEPIRKDGSPINLASDCGSACRQIMGSGRTDVAVIKGRGESKPSGALGAGLGVLAGIVGLGGLGAGIGYAAGGKNNGLLGLGIGAAIGGVIGAVAGGFAGSAIEKSMAAKPQSNEEFLTPRTYHGGAITTPQEWSEEIFKKEFGKDLTRKQALAKYDALSAEDKDKFDRKYGINKYAVPRVGQGITIGTETDMPGYQDPSGNSWNFHYAANVLSSGADYITLESAAGWSPTDWIFFMYGPETKGQSFYEEQRATGTHGTKNTAMVVQSN